MLNLLVSQPPPVAIVTDAAGTGSVGSIWIMHERQADSLDVHEVAVLVCTRVC